MAAAASASAPTSKQKESFLGRLNRKIEAIKITDAGYDTVDFLKAIRKIPGVFALIIGEGKTTSMLASDVQVWLIFKHASCHVAIFTMETHGLSISIYPVLWYRVPHFILSHLVLSSVVINFAWISLP